MDWTVWMMFALTEGAVTLTPGPAVLFVVSQALRYGPADSLRSAVGILAANVLFFTISATGVGALVAASGSLLAVVKWAGAAYLLYLAVMAQVRPPILGRAPGTSLRDEPRRYALFLHGFVLQLSNPKALLFFVAILPQFIDRARPVVPQLFVLGVTSIVIELAVLAGYGVSAGRAARVALQPRFATVTSRLSGLLLAGAALGLLRLER
ncbi:MAG TPA: LysE family translocator [Vicinamibacteria bacterium]|nr:LysE family translocator [Vicinamibacteria bacterium]